jgi:hypothetical protein
LDQRLHLIEIEWLIEVRIGRHATGLLVSGRRHQNDWDALGGWVSLQPLAQSAAVEHRHHQIRDDQVGSLVRNQLQRLVTVLGYDRTVAHVVQHRGQQFPDRRFIVDDQDHRHRYSWFNVAVGPAAPVDSSWACPVSKP